MIIEFNGLPGSGKTVLKGRLVQALNDRDVIGAGVDEFRGTGSSKLKKLMIKGYRLLSPLFLWNLGFWLRCRRLLRANQGETNVFPYRSRYEKMIVAAYLVYLYQVYRRHNKTVIVDEGFVQTFSAIAVRTEKGKMAAEVMDSVFRRFGDILTVNIDISVEDTYTNIQDRNRHDSAMDAMTGEDLRRFLLRYDEKLKEMRGTLHTAKAIDVRFDRSAIADLMNTIIEGIAKYE